MLTESIGPDVNPAKKLRSHILCQSVGKAKISHNLLCLPIG